MGKITADICVAIWKDIEHKCGVEHIDKVSMIISESSVTIHVDKSAPKEYIDSIKELFNYLEICEV